MEDAADPLHIHVLSFLTAEERNEIPDAIRTKVAVNFEDLTRKVHGYINQKQKDRIAHEGQVRTLEGQLKELRESSNTANDQLNRERKTSEEYVEKYRSSLATINQLEASLQNIQSSFNETSLKLATVTAEKEGLVTVLERRMKEIEDLNDDKKTLSEQLHSTTGAKVAALFKIDEFTSQQIDLDYREKELEKEREWVNKQVQLLNTELDRKNERIVDMQRDHTSSLLSIQAELAQKGEELRQAELSLVNARALNSNQEAQLERLLQKLRESQEMELKIEENYRVELQTQSKLANLYKEDIDDSLKRVQELESAITNLQGLLAVATDRYGELESNYGTAAKSYQEEVASRDTKIAALEVELKQANTLLKDLHEKGLTDEMIESLSPAAAAVSHLLRGTHSLTEIYSKLTTAQEELLLLQAENAGLREELNNIVNDIAARGPLVKAQKEDYARCLETVDALTNQLEIAMDSEAKIRDEYSLARKTLGSLERENARLKSQITDNCNQIKVLVREVENLRGTYSYDMEADEDLQSGVVDSSRLITSNLVTFRNIDELQSQNAYLLTLVRELSEEREKVAESADDRQVAEIKAAYEEVLKELEEVKEMRMRQESILTTVREQTFSPAKLKSPHAGTSGKTNESPHISISESTTASEGKYAQLQKNCEELQEDFDTYKKERSTNERISAEQMEKLRDDLTRLRTDNVKLSSQIEYNNERCKIYLSNLDTYKKSIASLEEKNKQLSLSVAKHEQSSQILRNELLGNQEKLARAEVSLSTLTTERNSLRDGKSRLVAELELYKREGRTCKMLEINLAEIKNNLELASSSSKLKLETELESLKAENALLRRKTEAEGEQLKANFTTWEKVTRELEGKAKDATEGHEKIKAELGVAAGTIRSQRVEIEKLLGQVQVLTGHGNAAATLQTLQNLQAEKDVQTRELNSKIATLEREAISSKQQMVLLKSNVDEYKALAKSLEDQIGASNDTMMEDKLRCKDDMIRELQLRLDAIEREAAQFKSEKEALAAELGQKAESLSTEMSRLEREVQIGNSKLAVAMEENTRLKTDLERQLALTREFQTKYDNELGFHSAVVENRNEIRNELDSLREELAGVSRQKILLEEELSELKAGNEGRDKKLLLEIERLTTAVAELDTLNTSLQDQLLSLSTQLEGKRNLETPGGMDTSFSSTTEASFIEDEEKSRSTEHWVQLLRYMRRQKEISYGKLEVSESTVARLKSQLEFSERQCKELEEKYNQLQSQSQTSLITSSKTAELLRKIETLSALTDSNRVLREERENLVHQVEALNARTTETESRIEPLMARLASLEGNIEMLTAENTGLKQDVGRWRSRANALIEKTNKFNPEEMKKVTAEKDSLQKQLTATEEVRKKLYADTVRMDASMKASHGQVTQLQATIQSTTEQNKKMTEELKRVNDYKTGLATELEKLQKELVEMKKQFESKVTELQGSETAIKQLTEEVEMQKGNVKQIKLLARKYKKSYEDAVKGGEGAGSAEGVTNAPLTASSDQVSAAVPAAQIAEFESKIAEISAKNESLQKDLESLKQETSNREERAKVALKTMRDKVSSIAQQKSETDMELSSTKTKLTSMEASSEEANIRHAALKSQYEARLSRMEAENKELRSNANVVPASGGTGAGTSEVVCENEALKKENEMQKQRIVALEKQLLLKSASMAGTSGTQLERKSTAVPGPDPPKANIKPIGNTSKGTTTQVVPPSASRPQPTASIRPMSMLRKATVMPTTAATAPPQPVHHTMAQPGQGSSSSSAVGLIAPAPVSQAQVSTSTPDQSVEAPGHHQPPVTSSAPTGTVTNSTNVRQATVQPTQALPLMLITTASGSGPSAAAEPSVSASPQQVPPTESSTPSGSHAQEPPATSTTSHLDSEMGDSSEQVSSSESSLHQTVIPVAPIRSTGQEVEESTVVQSAVSSQEVEGGAVAGPEEPSPSTSSSRPAQSSKRSREDEVETSEEAPPREEPDSKRSRLAPQSSEAEARSQGHTAEGVGAESEEDEAPQVPHSGRTRPLPTSHRDRAEDEEDKDSDVVVIESSDDEENDGGNGGEDEDEEVVEDEEEREGEEEGDEEDVEAEEALEEYEDIGDEDEDQGDDDIEIIHQEDAEEGREAESIEEVEESMEEGEEEDEAQSGHGMLDEAENSREGDGSQEVVLLDMEDDYEVDMNQEAGEASPVNPNGSEETLAGQNVPRPQVPGTATRQQPSRPERPNTYQQPQPQQLPMTPSYHMYAGEEPDDSIVPSTPTLFVPRRTDGFAEAVSSPHVSSLGHQFLFGGVDENRLDFHQFEEGSGRSVPSTPVQVSPPTEVGDQEESGLEEGELERGDGQPSSSNIEPRAGHSESFGTVPSISVSAPSDRNSAEEARSDGSGRQQQVASEAERAEEAGNEVPRTETSVTSSDEDKLDSGPGSSGNQGQGPSRPSSAEQQLTAQQQQQQQRTRPTPIVWDQPTSSSSALGGLGLSRGGHRGGVGSRPVPLLRTLPAPAPEAPPGLLRGAPFARARGGQSARRSRPHGGPPRRGAPY